MGADQVAGRRRTGSIVKRREGAKHRIQTVEKLRQRRPVGRVDPLDRRMRTHHGAGLLVRPPSDHTAQAVDPPWRHRPSQGGNLQEAREPANLCGRKTEGRQGMLQERKQRHAGEAAGKRVDKQQRECALRGGGERRAGGIVDLKMPTGEFRRHSSCEVAVGGDKRGGAARLVEHMPHDQGDGHASSRRVGAVMTRMPSSAAVISAVSKPCTVSAQ